uniref:BTB domain-containing protein n=1 Tax=Meloidogyne hapla TaxID=6305 RepID=A0A1I8B9S3_MELHA
MNIITSGYFLIVDPHDYDLKDIYRKNKLKSKVFYNTDFPKVKWELCVSYRNGLNKAKVWIRQIGPNNLNSLVNTKYVIYTYYKGNTCVDIARSTNEFENQEQLGYTSFSLNKFFSFFERLFCDGRLFVFCDVEFDLNYYKSNHYLQDIYRGMLEEEIFTDCVIKIGNEVIKTHRCVLAKNSKVFHKMFEQNGTTEAQNGEVVISDTTPECVRAMLEFFYTGMVSDELMKTHVENIFAIAYKYQVEMLQHLCERFMYSNINKENIVKYCGIIDLYEKIPTLEKECINYILANKKSFLKSKEWEEIKSNYDKLAFRFSDHIIKELNKSR